jgi:hypothetical protein
MSEEGAPSRLSLSYELQPRDLEDTQAVMARRRRRQVRALVIAVPLVALAVALIGLTARHSPGAPAWLYAADLVSCALLAFQLRFAWLLSPKRLARIIWRTNPGYRGRHHEEIDERGVTWTAPTGSQIFVPWAVVASVRETGHAFHLMDSGGNVRSSLPKRGLASPELVPVLRDLLNGSAGSRPSAATAV